jgi:hypothetical protein
MIEMEDVIPMAIGRKMASSFAKASEDRDGRRNQATLNFELSNIKT